ncbi:sensor histidine kinase [Hymenobacter translucens]|uniref:sensor histidine kinase n=1 Tax=Hymenobacter translucens TaxID=2886507 RepID=UPI001D0E93FF|nr:sensor histidine kinase [Hymenobacter translucens]
MAATDTARVRKRLEEARLLLARSNDSAAVLCRELLRASYRLRYPFGMAQSNLLLGMVLRNQSEFDSAFFYGRRAEALFERQGRLDGLSSVYTLYAQTYKRMGDAQGVALLSRKGLKQANLALAMAERGPYPAPMVSALLSQGIIYRDLKLPDSARQCYQRAIRIEETQPCVPSSLGVAYANYGQLQMDFYHNIPGAIRLLRKALALHHRHHNRNGLEHAYRNLSWAYRRQGDHARAVATADSCLVLGRAIGDPHRLSNSLEASYFAHRDARRYPQAIALMEEWRNLENELGRVEKTQAVARIEAAYRLEKQQARIARLDQDNARQQTQLWGLAAGLALLAGLLGLSFWQYRVIRRANACLQATNQTISENNARIQDQASRLTLLMRELHHRVKNNLAIVSSLLNLQSSRLTDAAAARAVREGQQRVEAMGLIHQRLYQTADVTTVDMTSYITNLVEGLLAAYGYDDSRFDLVLELDLPTHEVDQAVPLGLIINELVTNALKYAYQNVARPILRIRLVAAPGSDAGGLLLEVEDNGPGIDPAQWQAPDTSFGKQLILALSEQMGGTVTMRNQAGAFFQLLVPGSTPEYQARAAAVQ